MIYLIDEKKNRQFKYGWSNDHFATYSNRVTLISDYKTLKDVSLKKILESPENIIMIHNSFFKNLKVEEKELFEFKNRIRRNGNILIIFGGSFNKTSINSNELEMPVAAFYKNLELFLNQQDYNLLVLAYGLNSEKELWLGIRNKIDNYLFPFEFNHDLSDNEVFEIQKLSDFNSKIVEVLDTTQNVGYIKSLLKS